MKNTFLLAAVLLATSLVQAQFQINGEIKGYDNKPIFLKITENGEDRLVQRLETDSQGKFKYKFPFEYVGRLVMDMSVGAFDMVSDNGDIEFSTDLNDQSHKFYFTKGINKDIDDYYRWKERVMLRDNTFVQLKKIYKPEEDFYKAVEKEITAINAKPNFELKDDALKYYIESKDVIAKLNGKDLSGPEINRLSKSHIINDNMYLENFGFLVDYLSAYISTAFIGATSKEDAEVKIENSLDELLNEAQTDTSRGQNILTTIIPMLESNGFQNQANKYINMAESLTCEITPELKELLSGKTNIKVGAKAPNIEFGKKIKGANSLYDVKSDKKLVIFWASWCPHCVNEMPFIKEYYNTFKSQGGEIVAVSLDMEAAAWEQAISGTEWINYSDLLKWDSPLVKSYSVGSTPSMYLLDKDNKILKIGHKISDFIDAK